MDPELGNGDIFETYNNAAFLFMGDQMEMFKQLARSSIFSSYF